MAEIVGSLFGVSPDMYRRASQERDFAQAQAIGARASAPGTMMSPSLAPIYAEAAQQGQLIGRGVGALLGAQDPELQRITQIQQLSSQFDLSSAEGMRDFARALQPIAPNESMMATKRADEMATSGLARQKTAADIQRAEGLATKAELSAAQEEKLRAELSTLPPNATEQQILSVVTKYGSPDKILQVLTQSQDRRAKISAAAAGRAAKNDGVEGAGPVGKSGAYRDADGIVYSASEMAKQRAGFQGLEKLADNLNSITTEDVKNAESFFDYTQGETLKTIGGKISPKTISAQAKINASQLLKQIESLPPGSASNADMVAAKSSFPGYGSAVNLDAWILDTKTKLNSSLQRQSEQYGFKQKVPVTGLIGAPLTPKGSQNQEALDWLKANPTDPRVPAIKKKLGIQ